LKIKAIIADDKEVEIVCQDQTECETARDELIDHGVYSIVDPNPPISDAWVIVIKYAKNELSRDEIADIIKELTDNGE
jgi:hypothetical protein